MNQNEKKCAWHGCNQLAMQSEENVLEVCEYHRQGGIFGRGTLFEQYAIIEEDFLRILKYVPLDKANFKLVSPRFSDILIRCCVNIEIFFKEWTDHIKYNETKFAIEIRKKKKKTINDFCVIFSKDLVSSPKIAIH